MQIAAHLPVGVSSESSQDQQASDALLAPSHPRFSFVMFIGSGGRPDQTCSRPMQLTSGRLRQALRRLFLRHCSQSRSMSGVERCDYTAATSNPSAMIPGYTAYHFLQSHNRKICSDLTTLQLNDPRVRQRPSLTIHRSANTEHEIIARDVYPTLPRVPLRMSAEWRIPAV